MISKEQLGTAGAESYVAVEPLNAQRCVETFKISQSQTGAGHANPAAGFAEDGTPFGASRARGDVYVTDLGGGRQIVTFITWAR